MSRETVRNLSLEPFCPLPLDEKFLATLCKGLIEAVFVVELPSCVVVYCNAGAEALFGYPAAEIVQQTTARLFAERSTFDRLYQMALPEINTNGFWRGEWEYRRSDGSRFTAKATGTLLRTDGGSYMTLVVREITKRKEMEEIIHHLNQQLAERVTEKTAELISATQELEKKERQRKEIEQILGLLIRNITNYAVFVVDLDGHIVQWNRGAERLLGYAPDEVLEEHFSRFYSTEEEKQKQFAEMLKETANQESFSGYYWLVRKDGSRLYAQVIVIALRDDANALKAFLVIFRDDTEQRVMREQLREKEHLAAIGTAAAMLAHEIKNPLNGISTTVQLLERSLGKAQPTKETMMATVRDLENEIGRLQALLGDFQTISLPQRLNFQPVDLSQVVREITTLVDEECRKSKIEILVERAADLPLVEADPDKIKQALLNLIKNSCEAMPNGGTLTIKGYVCGSEVCLDVIDTGEGIPEGLQIFDFFTSTKPGGTGLGLVIVQQIILAHGGSVTVSSQAGKGTTFRLRLHAPQKSAT